MLADGAGLTALAEQAIAGLTRYPYYVRIAGFGVDRSQGKMLARLISLAPPLHPRKPFEKLSSSKIRVDPEAFAKGGDHTRYSQTAESLAAHTDSSFLPDPHDLVAFQMHVPDPDGGESFMVPARDAVAALDEPTRTRLRAPVFLFGGILQPILSGTEDDPKLRYYRRQLDEECAPLGGLPADDVAALDALDAVLDRADIQHRFRLAAGEIVLMNNLRVLHGRTGMAASSTRLMYRLRAFAGCLL